MDHPTKTSHRPEDDASDSLLKGDSDRGETPLIKDGSGQLPRRPSSADAIQQCLLDILVAIPAVCFIFYGFAVLVNHGLPINQHPIPALQMAAKYSPTLFPITFSAIAANFLKATAAWKLEKGITVLSLEYLQKCRTVFGAITTPLSLRAINAVVPFLIGFWALSPLGGQAALRIMDVVPSAAIEEWPFEYLEFMSTFPHAGPTTSAGYTVMASIQATFTAALSSPMDSKKRSQDLFGNIKIPMVEYYQQSSQASEIDGWYNVDPMRPMWSSLIGLPVTSLNGLSVGSNYSFVIETSYMSTSCSISHIFISSSEWRQYRNSSHFQNNRNLAIRYSKFVFAWDTEPLEIVFTSAFGAKSDTYLITNATCILNQVYAKVEVGCQGPVCAPGRIRRIPKSENATIRTVLHQAAAEGHRYLGPPSIFDAYMSTFIKAGLSLYDLQSGNMIKPYASAIETYFMDPAAPYSSPGITSWDGTNMSSIGDAVFSQRFSQLLNTFWLASVASRNVTGFFNFNDTYSSGSNRIVTQNTTGTRVPDHLVMRVNWTWLSILFVASVAMLASGIVAAVFNCLRRGPDVLDHSAMFFRDSPYVNVATSEYGSMEDASDQVKRIRGVRVCIGDVDGTRDVGRLAFATVDGATPLSAQKAGRRYV